MNTQGKCALFYLISYDERRREVSIRDKGQLRNLRCAYI